LINIYLKFLKKNWFWGVIPPLLVAILVPAVGSIWPELENQMAAFSELLNSPAFQFFVGLMEGVDITTWTGFYYIEIFTWLEMVILFVTIFVPARLVSAEVDKKTLDFILSYPIARWRYVLEKFSVFLTYNLLYPAFVLVLTYQSIVSLNVEMDLILLSYSLIGIWMLMFALGALSLLCGIIFFEPNRAIAAAGLLILGQYILVRIGAITESLNFLKSFSLFNYLNANTIVNLQKIPLDELLIVFVVAILALIGALAIFQKREISS
jgi:ABC-2 type transport system permease protein